jgi:hypothetical protein
LFEPNISCKVIISQIFSCHSIGCEYDCWAPVV